MARGCSPSLPGVPLPPPPHGPCIRKGSHLGRRLPEEASEVMASFSAQAWSGQLSPGQSRRQRTGRDPARRGGGRWPLTCPPLAWQMGPEAEWLGQVPPPPTPQLLEWDLPLFEEGVWGSESANRGSLFS